MLARPQNPQRCAVFAFALVIAMVAVLATVQEAPAAKRPQCGQKAGGVKIQPKARRRGNKICSARRPPQQPVPATPVATGSAAPDPVERASTCPLATPGSEVGMALPDCSLVASDTAGAPDPIPFWGSIDAVDPSRATQLTSGGDTHFAGDGTPQANTSFRRLNVHDGDDFYGERAELGLNDRRTGPTTFYEEGERRVTYFSTRLPDSLQLDRLLWQVVMQMKQTQPSSDIGTPVIELDAYDGRWVLLHSTSNGPDPTYGSETLWSVPAQHNEWTRFAFDVTYSKSASQGSMKVYVDLDGDGDFQDAQEQSPTFKTHTLKYEPSSPLPPNDALPAGSSVPSHLRVGPYHSPSYACPAPAGCSVEVDNVQVLAP